MPRTPDFLIIGAQKCGTSWLHHQLRQADGIFMPGDKDFEHFSYVGNLNDAAFERYCARFDLAAPGQLAGDANAAYFWTRTGSAWSRQPDSFNPDIPRSVRAFCGADLKLVLMLRDPVERAVSAYLHHVRHGAITYGTSILDRSLPLGIVDMGFYRTHLRNWLAAYPREQLHIVRRLPESDAAAIDAVEAVCDFLGVAPPPRERYYLEPVFPGLPRVIDAEGVWVADPDAGEDEAAADTASSRRIGGKRYRRVVTAEELAALHGILDAQSI